MEIKLTLPFGEKLYVGDVAELFSIKKIKFIRENNLFVKGIMNILLCFSNVLSLKME